MNTLILGGSGYIGSFLRTKLPYNITSIDLEWFDKNDSIVSDFNDLNENFISNYDSIILLAGHSSVKMCEGDAIHAFNNNVTNFINLLKKIKNTEKRIKLIYASSSSVYGKTGNSIVNEDYKSFIPYNNYDITKHIIDVYSKFFDVEYYGLRFGTVNGYSPIMRSDLMINSMTSSALTSKKIDLYYGETIRPILGIEDLYSAMVKIIEEKKDLRGIYNLASFNSTSEIIANTVSDITGCPVIKQQSIISGNSKMDSKNYNFSIDSSKFCNTFNFEFKENIETITKSIVNNFDSIKLTKRDKPFIYGL